jgi:hypothetical protein
MFVVRFLGSLAFVIYALALSIVKDGSSVARLSLMLLGSELSQHARQLILLPELGQKRGNVAPRLGASATAI